MIHSKHTAVMGFMADIMFIESDIYSQASPNPFTQWRFRLDWNLQLNRSFRCIGSIVILYHHSKTIPDNKVHGANMGPTWVLSAQYGPHVAPWTLLSGVCYKAIILYNDPNNSAVTSLRLINCIFLSQSRVELNNQASPLCPCILMLSYTQWYHSKWKKSYPFSIPNDRS